MAEKLNRPWLPEDYSKFHQIDSRLQRWGLPSSVIWSTWIAAGIMAMVNPEYANHFLQPHVVGTGLGAYFLTLPNLRIPNINFIGRRLHRDLYKTAYEISRNEGLDFRSAVPRVRKTLALAGKITPLNRALKWNQTPKDMLTSFPGESNIAHLDPNDRLSVRKALYIGEAYWKRVFEYPNRLPAGRRSQAKAMLEEIKIRLGSLSFDRHVSF